jgi:FkbM family methyltransferase
MSQNNADFYKAAVLAAAANPVIPVIPDLMVRPVFFCAPYSVLGLMHCQAIAAKLKHVVAVIDDISQETHIYGIPRWTTVEFLERARQYKNALALDFSVSPWTRSLFASITAATHVELWDCTVAQAQFDLVSVYESVNIYREKTLERLDDFLALAERFDDDFSRETLYANLLFRLTFDRASLLKVWSDPTEEYFSTFAQPTTFRLGSREHYVDCGAYQGPIIHKFLGATSWQYSSITAFEPDKTNFKTLSKFSAWPLHDLKLINKAVSSRTQTLRFHETGTVSSYVSAEGGVLVQTARLDDEVEHLSFLKMDVEGFEQKTLQGAKGLLASDRPRIASCVYHYALDLLNIVDTIDNLGGDYHYRLRQHNGSYYYDLVLYASPIAGVNPEQSVA